MGASRRRRPSVAGTGLDYQMNREEVQRRFAAAQVAHLATIRPTGTPHLIPITFVLEGKTVLWAVDHKPKTSDRLQRLFNIETHPEVSLMVDHYHDDWRYLWWVRADGKARVITDDDEADDAIELLVRKYKPYRERRPQGPVVAIDVKKWRGWTAG